MYNDEIFQKIATTPGLNALELAAYFGRQKGVIYQNLIRLEKYDVLYTRQEPSPNSRGKASVKTYYVRQSALKYKR